VAKKSLDLSEEEDWDAELDDDDEIDLSQPARTIIKNPNGRFVPQPKPAAQAAAAPVAAAPAANASGKKPSPNVNFISPDALKAMLAGGTPAAQGGAKLLSPEDVRRVQATMNKGTCLIRLFAPFSPFVISSS